jgi:predicted transcriptional regulator
MGSAGHAEKGLGALEGAVMKLMWASDQPMSVRDVFERLNRRRSRPLAYTTVMTVMARLAEKGILSRRLVGRSYEYEAIVPDVAAIAVRGVMRDFGQAALAHFVDEARANPKLLRRLERLVNGGE